MEETLESKESKKSEERRRRQKRAARITRYILSWWWERERHASSSCSLALVFVSPDSRESRKNPVSLSGRDFDAVDDVVRALRAFVLWSHEVAHGVWDTDRQSGGGNIMRPLMKRDTMVTTWGLLVVWSFAGSQCSWYVCVSGRLSVTQENREKNLRDEN